jgi:hypothetical protein
VKRALLLAPLAAGALAAAAAGATSPRTLVLKKSDVPAGAKRIAFGSATGTIKLPRRVHGRAAYVAYKFKNGKRVEVVGSAAAIVVSTPDAHAAFTALRRNLVRRSTFYAIRLPKYGDEQFAMGITIRPASAAVLVVRSGTKLWEVGVSNFPGLTKARLKVELSKYAGKADARAG